MGGGSRGGGNQERKMRSAIRMLEKKCGEGNGVAEVKKGGAWADAEKGRELVEDEKRQSLRAKRLRGTANKESASEGGPKFIRFKFGKGGERKERLGTNASRACGRESACRTRSWTSALDGK